MAERAEELRAALCHGCSIDPEYRPGERGVWTKATNALDALDALLAELAEWTAIAASLPSSESE